jgi:hypothetical protein
MNNHVKNKLYLCIVELKPTMGMKIKNIKSLVEVGKPSHLSMCRASIPTKTRCFDTAHPILIISRMKKAEVKLKDSSTKQACSHALHTKDNSGWIGIQNGSQGLRRSKSVLLR